MEHFEAKLNSDNLANLVGVPLEGRRRVLIEAVSPQLDGGRFPIKRVLGERVLVEASIFADGHDAISAVLRFRTHRDSVWIETPMRLLPNDLWQGEFITSELGVYHFTVEAWIDRFKSWRQSLQKKIQAGQNVGVDLAVGADLIEDAARRAEPKIREGLSMWAKEIRGLATVDSPSISSGSDAEAGIIPAAISSATQRGDSTEATRSRARALDDSLAHLMALDRDRRFSTVYEPELRVVVDPVLARFGSWYEIFPRSCSPDPGRHGTFRDCEDQLGRISQMGFDVLYFPPIHPIGRSFRKGKNNNPICQSGEPGSPWAIGATEGGHKSVHPELGNLNDFRRLVTKAKELKIEVALDIAFQCSPDHPYLKEHPEWFLRRPDGSIQYAENPPKKYQDIYPFNFECDDWRGLWVELKSVFEFWIQQGIRVFRVDNPHTKAFPFWEWCIGELKQDRPGLIFLAESFTRPKLLYRLAKLGFTQSYNYYPWRNTKQELIEYFTELNCSAVAEFFRPNLWPNTPDILPLYLQESARPGFIIRLVLAATLGASYGIYGPGYELFENTPRVAGSEEYLNSEKYEIRQWDHQTADGLEPLITRVNLIRREHPALHSNRNLHFHRVDNEQILAYTKSTEEGGDTVLVLVNLDPRHTQRGWVEVPLDEFKLNSKQAYQMHDLLTESRFLWNGTRNFVELNPQSSPAYVFALGQRQRSERDFDYFM